MNLFSFLSQFSIIDAVADAAREAGPTVTGAKICLLPSGDYDAAMVALKRAGVRIARAERNFDGKARIQVNRHDAAQAAQAIERAGLRLLGPRD